MIKPLYHGYNIKGVYRIRMINAKLSNGFPILWIKLVAGVGFEPTVPPPRDYETEFHPLIPSPHPLLSKQKNSF